MHVRGTLDCSSVNWCLQVIVTVARKQISAYLLSLMVQSAGESSEANGLGFFRKPETRYGFSPCEVRIDGKYWGLLQFSTSLSRQYGEGEEITTRDT